MWEEEGCRRVVGKLVDVAAASGVSRSTVSRVLNDGAVSEDTRRRVLAAMEQTGYRPNLAARTLASGRSGVVGVVIHVPAEVLFQDIFFSGLFHGISEGLAERGAGMMLWLANLSKEQTLERILGMRLFDGLLVTADTLDDPLVDGLVASDLPTVLIGHRHKDRSASYVDIHNERAAEQVVDHLIGLGRHRIGHIAGRQGGTSAEERLSGYRRAMKRAGLPTDGLIVRGDYLTRSGEEGAAKLIDAGVDAIFAASDSMAVGALAELARRGIGVPDDVAVAGFDDVAEAAAADPPLTTMRQDTGLLGMEAAHTLFRLLGDAEAVPQRVILPTELIVRQSTVGSMETRRTRYHHGTRT
jgi:DNA-binding LacI/PurR family transcriptional regulator